MDEKKFAYAPIYVDSMGENMIEPDKEHITTREIYDKLCKLVNDYDFNKSVEICEGVTAKLYAPDKENFNIWEWGIKVTKQLEAWDLIIDEKIYLWGEFYKSYADLLGMRDFANNALETITCRIYSNFVYPDLSDPLLN